MPPCTDTERLSLRSRRACCCTSAVKSAAPSGSDASRDWDHGAGRFAAAPPAAALRCRKRHPTTASAASKRTNATSATIVTARAWR